MQSAIDTLDDSLTESKQRHKKAIEDFRQVKSVYDNAQRNVVSIEVEIAGLENSIAILTKELEGE